MIEESGYNNDIWALNDTTKLPGIGQTVMFQPLCGLLQQTKYLPSRYAPLGIELELADVLDPIVSDFAAEDSIVAGVFKASNTSFFGKSIIVWSRLIYAQLIML